MTWLTLLAMVCGWVAAGALFAWLLGSAILLAVSAVLFWALGLRVGW